MSLPLKVIQDYHHLYFKELEGDDALFDFEVMVHRQFIELIISEKICFLSIAFIMTPIYFIKILFII